MDSSGTSSVSISALLKKTEHYDKDERYMATSDLCEVLKRQQNQSELNASTERQICTAVLRLLHDKSNDVQAIAVKTLGVLLTTVQQEQVIEIADSLADQVLDASKSELRDVYAIGLRTLVKTVPASMGNRVAQRLVGRLLDGIRTSENEEIVLACLDALTDLLQRFGASALSVTRQHEPVLQMCLSQLSSPFPVVRKRAGNTIGCLSIVLTDALLMRMVEALLSQMDMASSGSSSPTASSSSTNDTRALIRTMCTVSGAVGHRLGQEQIDRILPIFLRFTKPEDAVTGDDDDGDDEAVMSDAADEANALVTELRESCFMGLESFVLRCPSQVEPHLDKIVEAALAFMSYDPNYSYGTDDEEDSPEEEDELEYDDEEDEYEEDEEDDDDDDESWKVRRSAIRALRAVVEAKRHDPSPLWQKEYSIRDKSKSSFVSALVGRFKEREENCRVGVIDCFTRLLAVTIQADTAGVIRFTDSSGDHDKMDTTAASTVDLSSYSFKLVRTCDKILTVRKGNERSKSSALALLATLCDAPGGVGGDGEIATVFSSVRTFLAGTDPNAALHREVTSKALRLDALSLVRAMLTSDKHDPVHIRKSLLTALLPELSQGVNEQWYKVIAEALRALSAVPHFFVVGYGPGDSDATKKKEGEQVAAILYTAIEPLLAAHDVDQEIKECALKACASLLSSLHSSLSADKQTRLLKLVLERLKNETTRIAGIKTLSAIAAAAGDADAMVESEGRIDLAPILAESIASMASFLKLQSRSLKQTSLEALDTIITHHGTYSELSGGELYSSVLQDFATLIVDSDLHLSHLSLRATVSVLKVCPNAGPAVKAHTLDHALHLSTSALLQDLAQHSLLEFFKQMVVSGAIEFQELSFLLRQRLTGDVGKHGVYNLAKCIAVITSTTSQETGTSVLGEILSLLEGADTPDEADTLRQVQLSLLITGDLGRIADLNTMKGAAERLKAIYIRYFDSLSDDLKHAAAYALGNASVGSPATFLPSIVGKLDEDNKKQQYLLLSALREFIQSSFRESGGAGIAPTLATIVPPLEKHCADEEEGVRTMVAECMGSLTSLQPETMLPKLVELQKSHSDIKSEKGMIEDGDDVSKKNSLVCWTVGTSVKLAIAGKVDTNQLAAHMPTFVQLLQQTELSVRNVALLMVYSAIHHMPQVISTLLTDSVMPALYEVSDLKLERKVDLGPFTHKVDDALPLRKSALSIFATCLDNLPGCIDSSAFMPVLAKALGDAEDIQLHAHQIVISMCSKQPTYLVASVESFVEPLEKTVNKKPGQKTGTELERLNDWIKSALRVILTLSRLEGVMNSRVFADFVGRVKGNSKFSGMLESLGEETN